MLKPPWRTSRNDWESQWSKPHHQPSGSVPAQTEQGHCCLAMDNQLDKTDMQIIGRCWRHTHAYQQISCGMINRESALWSQHCQCSHNIVTSIFQEILLGGQSKSSNLSFSLHDTQTWIEWINCISYSTALSTWHAFSPYYRKCKLLEYSRLKKVSKASHVHFKKPDLIFPNEKRINPYKKNVH